jgi:predicted Fe-Mo cluster-binding NifX family protein
MKVAFAAWNDRIAPVFDVSGRLHLCDIERGCVVREVKRALTEASPDRKAIFVAEMGVETLVCGAISRALYDQIVSRGIRVVPFVAGDLREVIRSWTEGRFNAETFAMPGCWRRGEGRFASPGFGSREGGIMNGRGRGGLGSGGGQGQGRGRLGGPLAVGAGGACLCPKCGHREPHKVGVPCLRTPCPKCGTAMTRE